MVAGVHVGNRQQIIESRVSVDGPVLLKRDRHNRYDANAIAVTSLKGELIGYVPHEDAQELASLFDDRNQYAATVTKILGYNKAIPVIQADFYGPDALASTLGRPLRRCASGGALGVTSQSKLPQLVGAVLVIAGLLAFCSR